MIAFRGQILRLMEMARFSPGARPRSDEARILRRLLASVVRQVETRPAHPKLPELTAALSSAFDQAVAEKRDRWGSILSLDLDSNGHATMSIELARAPHGQEHELRILFAAVRKGEPESESKPHRAYVASEFVDVTNPATNTARKVTLALPGARGNEDLAIRRSPTPAADSD
ncbi:MAG: hypothetical protein IPL40_07780 [Proteobacteria bacterium]|nr:hypothetical protein [Pseudomonadota bacterium]